MLRNVGGVVLGYLVMAVFMFITLTIAYKVMGTDRAFEFDTYDVTGLWIVTGVVLSLLAAILGGLLCALVTRGGKAPYVLAGVVFVLGIVAALPSVMSEVAPQVGTRPAEVGIMEAMRNAREPKWLSLLSPVLSALGVVLGARTRVGRKTV